MFSHGNSIEVFHRQLDSFLSCSRNACEELVDEMRQAESRRAILSRVRLYSMLAGTLHLSESRLRTTRQLGLARETGV